MIRIRVEVENDDDRITYDRTGKDPDDKHAVMAASFFGEAFAAILGSCVPAQDDRIIEQFIESAGLDLTRFVLVKAKYLKDTGEADAAVLD